MIYQSILDKYKPKLKQFSKFFSKVKKQKHFDLDSKFKKYHFEVFKKISCLECANCCKSISPIITKNDIKRISKNFNLKEGLFIDKYLNIDNEGDYVFKQTPCPFLGEDNYCLIYEIRPNACFGYPHTDRDNIKQIISLTVKNIEYCPAVAEICNTIYSEQKNLN